MNDERNIRTPEKYVAIQSATCQIGFEMASDPITCSLLRTLVVTKPNGQILELGTGTGLSTAWLLDGMDAGSQLLSVDNDEKLLAIARQELADDDRLTLLSQDAGALIASLKGRLFDFIFADTWSGKYFDLEETLALLAPGGIYFIDDMLPQPSWPDDHAIKVKNLIELLEGKSDFELSKLSWGTGVIILTKKSGNASK